MLNISEGNKTSLESLQRYKTVKNLSNRPHYKSFGQFRFWRLSHYFYLGHKTFRALEP